MAYVSYFSGIVLYFLYIQLCLVVAQSNYYEPDKINALPGQPAVNFSQYSGYVSVDDNAKRSLFYYFVEAETDASSKPLIVWLPGGPGGAAIAGAAFNGHGPFRHLDGHLIRNEHSMNKVANMLYVESPAGVGFSYFPNMSYSSSSDDDSVARDDLIFLQRWLEKFQVLKNRDIYLGGQSYGGHFVPNLANVILQSNLKSNLKGLMLVSPLLNFSSDTGYEYLTSYLWTHGIISDSTYDFVRESPCDMAQYERESFTWENIPFMSPACKEVHSKFQISFRENKMFDNYDITNDRCTPGVSNYSEALNMSHRMQKLCESYIVPYYFQRSDVLEAFHAKFHTNGAINGDIFNHYDTRSVFKPMTATVEFIINSGVRVFVASGDQDGVISFLSTRSLLGKVATNMGLETTLRYMPWFKNLEQGQIGGWIQSYGHGILTYLTVKGGAHFLPHDNSRELVMLFDAWKNDKFPVKP